MDPSNRRVDFQQLTNDLRPAFRRLTQSADEADDAIQEAWARWIEKGYDFDDDATVKKQLTVIGRNFYFNREKQQNTEKRNRLTVLQLRPSFYVTDQKDIQLAELPSALEELDPLERQVVENRQYQSFADIADCLGFSESSVRRIHRRALARLRRRLSDV